MNTDNVTQQQLDSQHRDVTVPFQVSLANNVCVLTCHDIIRLLPHKRISCVGEWQGQTVFAKLFYASKRQKKHFEVEHTGAKNLEVVGVACPNTLYAGTSASGDIHIVIYEYINDAVNLSVALDANPQQLLYSLVNVFAKQHEAGLIHSDPHLDNFLVCNNQIISIDPAGLSHYGMPLPRWTSIANLALLYAQLPTDYYSLIDDSFKHYLSQRDIDFDPNLITQLHWAIAKTSEARQTTYLKKIMRDCTEFTVHKCFKYFAVSRRDAVTPEFEKLINNIDNAIENGSILKAGRSSTVALVKINDQSFVIKRYNIKNWRHAISRCWRPTRAWHSWRAANRLKLLGIATAKPIAMLEKRFGKLRSTSYFITEYSPGVTLDNFIASDPVVNTENIKTKILELFEKFVREKITHGDMKATNFIVNDDSIALIDLDGLNKHKSKKRFNRQHRHDKNRFLKNWQANPDIAKAFENLKF